MGEVIFPCGNCKKSLILYRDPVFLKHGEKIMKNEDIIMSLRRFKEMNQRKYNIIKIGLFGSAARESMSEQNSNSVLLDLISINHLYF